MLYIASTKGRCRKFLVGLPIGHSECEELYCCNFYDIYGALRTWQGPVRYIEHDNTVVHSKTQICLY